MLVAVLVCVPVTEVIVLEIDDDVTLVLSKSARQSKLISRPPRKVYKNPKAHGKFWIQKDNKLSVIPRSLLRISAMKLCFRSGCQ